jgi:hypothetical protein
MARVVRSTAFRLLVTAAILWYVLRDIDLAELGATLVHVSPAWLAGALLLVAADRAVMIARWIILLRSAGVALQARKAVWIYLVSSFLGSFVPAGVGADASRAYAVAVRTDQGTEAVASVAIDRVLGMMALVGLGLAGLAGWAPQLGPAMRTQVMLAVAVGGAGLAAVLWADRVVALLPARWLASRAGRLLASVGQEVGAFRRRPAVLAAVFALSIAVQFLRVLQGYCLGRGMGIEVELTYYLVFMPVGLLLMLLPVSIGGFGLPQGAIVWLLEPVGVTHARAFALSTLIALLGLVGNLPGAVLYLFRTKPVE